MSYGLAMKCVAMVKVSSCGLQVKQPFGWSCEKPTDASLPVHEATTANITT
ncbi:hypothetical protein SEA_KEELAN_98 [Gordonia phage Keelan]|nr:hypothetical protein SEA_KEELAN_98 [Gordonia phage Keelan]